jgi:hypothetical protein
MVDIEWIQHAFFDVSDIDLSLSPIGRQIQEIIDAQPEELFDPVLAEEFEELLGQDMPVVPIEAAAIEPDKPEAPTPPAPVEDLDTLAATLRFRRIAAQNEPREEPRKWTKAEPTPEPGWGHGEGLEPLS